MKNKIVFYLIVLVFILSDNRVFSQDFDSMFVFKNIQPIKIDTGIRKNAWGLDISTSDNGFGFGVFYRHQYSSTIFGFLNFLISDTKDNEVEYVDYWGNPYTPGKKNRVIMFPLTYGIQYRIFEDVIVENFKPYINCGAGPVILFSAPFSINDPNANDPYYPGQKSIEFFSSLKYGQAHYTAGGYFGIGANFGFDSKNLMGINIKYFYIPYPKGLEIMDKESTGIQPKKNFGGLYITLNFGIMY